MPNHAWLDELVPVLSEIAQDFHFEKVTLCDFSWGCVTKSTREFLLSRFSSATHLKLCTVDFWYTNELLKTLQSFPRLTQLEIVNCEWEFLNLSQEQATRTEELNLTHLILDEAHTQYDPVVLWLLGNGERAIVNVSSAHIVWENTDARCLVRLMEKIAPSLRNLTYRQKVKSESLTHDTATVFLTITTDFQIWLNAPQRHAALMAMNSRTPAFLQCWPKGGQLPRTRKLLQ